VTPLFTFSAVIVVEMFLRHDLIHDPPHFLSHAFWQFASAYIYFLPAYVTSASLFLFAASGFIIKIARTLNIGFDLFKRKFDIEKKPLQSMGFVAGTLVAMIYWALVVLF